MAIRGGIGRVSACLAICLSIAGCGASSPEAGPPDATTEASAEAGDVSSRSLDVPGVESFEISEEGEYLLRITPSGGGRDEAARLRGSDELLPSGVEVGDDRVVLAGVLCPLDDCEPRDLRVVVVDFGASPPTVDSLASFDADGSLDAVAAKGDEAFVVVNQNGTMSLLGIDVATADQRRLDWRPEPYDAAAIRARANASSDEVIDVPRTAFCAADGVLWAASSQGLGLGDEPITITAVTIDLDTGSATERGERTADLRDYPDRRCTDSELTLDGPSGELTFPQ